MKQIGEVGNVRMYLNHETRDSYYMLTSPASPMRIAMIQEKFP
jgi:hypothetical protein